MYLYPGSVGYGNMVMMIHGNGYSTVYGHLAYYAPGWVPIRGSGDGSLPVRGDIDEHEWLGYVPFEDLPHSYNPPGGIIATANSRVVPDGYPYFLTHAWAAAWRTARIFQMLEAGANFDVESMLRIDTDIHSLEDIHLAQDILDAAAARPPDNPEVKIALKVLRDWDGSATADSKATLICEVTRSLLFDRILRPKLGDSASDYHWALGFTFIENAIRHNWTRWLPPGDADFDMTLMRSLETALQRIPQLVGSRNPRDWNWGKTIPLTFHHPLDRLPEGRRIFDVGPFIQTGTGTTVKATTSRQPPTRSQASTGQVFSRYYRDQFPAWYTGHSFPMLFSHAAVSKGAVHSLRFLPLK